MRRTSSFLAPLLAVSLVACGDTSAPDASQTVAAPELARATTDAADGPGQRVLVFAERLNRALAAEGKTMRLTGAYFFTVGNGVPPFRTLRTGSRWTGRNLTYILDTQGFTSDAPAAAVENALEAAYATWTRVPNAEMHLTRVAPPAANLEFLDQVNLNADGTCTLFDGIVDPQWQGPYADIVHGGWINPDYFSKCLGSADIIAVTWIFSDVDSNHDNYDDLVYIEQYLNPRWHYVTQGSVYLDFDGPFDIQSIAVHEDGHAMGLDHTGGPNPNQPFKLHPNGRVFSPEAVMNPFDLGGEKRKLFPLDIAAFRTLYARTPF